MTAPIRNRRPAGQDNRRSGRGRTGSDSSSGNPLLLFGGLAAAGLVVGLVFLIGGGSGGAGKGGTDASPAKPASASPQSGTPPSSSPSGGAPKAGKTPDRPAPTIDPASLALAQQHYDTAKDKVNEGERARQSGDSGTYTAALQVAFQELESQRDALRPFTDWLEEADMGDWALPAEYTALQRKLGEYDKLFQRVKKLKQSSH